MSQPKAQNALQFRRTKALSAVQRGGLPRAGTRSVTGQPLRQRRPTMTDVARVAEVGVKTVSRVVNREGGVRDELVQRVEQAISALGYLHNAGASSLRRSDQSTDTIGLVVEDVGNPFSSLMHRGVEEACRERGLLLLVSSSDGEDAREQEAVTALSTRRIDGLILVPSGNNHTYLLPEIARGMPVVLVDRSSVDLPTADTVLCDNVGGAIEGTTQLISYGHRRIAHLGDSLTIETATRRTQGFKLAMTRAEIPVDDHLVRTGLTSVESAMQATRELLTGPNPPTAIFSGQNNISLGIIRVLRELSLHREIALVGFDDFLLADLLEPAITVVAQDPETMGRRAAEVLFRRLDGFTGPTEHVTIGARLLPRGSGEIRPPR
jgi:LacI family transcriptional regulator